MKILGYQFKRYRAPYRYIRRAEYLVRLSSGDKGRNWSAFVENQHGDVIASFGIAPNLESLVETLATEGYLA